MRERGENHWYEVLEGREFNRLYEDHDGFGTTHPVRLHLMSWNAVRVNGLPDGGNRPMSSPASNGRVPYGQPLITATQGW